MKFLAIPMAAALLCGGVLSPVAAQEKTTNAFDDLKRSGSVKERDSPMRRAASPAAGR